MLENGHKQHPSRWHLTCCAVLYIASVLWLLAGNWVGTVRHGIQQIHERRQNIRDLLSTPLYETTEDLSSLLCPLMLAVRVLSMWPLISCPLIAHQIPGPIRYWRFSLWSGELPRHASHSAAPATECCRPPSLGLFWVTSPAAMWPASLSHPYDSGLFSLLHTLACPWYLADTLNVPGFWPATALLTAGCVSVISARPCRAPPSAPLGLLESRL